MDTYWSDHCRHTTFTTVLTSIRVDESFMRAELEESLELYHKIRRELGRDEKPLCLMDLATIGARYLRKIGKLDDLEVSEENNACSIFVDVDVDGPRSNPSAALRPVWAVRSATRCRGAATSTRPCV